MPEELLLLMEKVETETKEALAPAPSYVPSLISFIVIWSNDEVMLVLPLKPFSQLQLEFHNPAP